MFSKIFKIASIACAMAAAVTGSPISRGQLSVRGEHSFNNWGGISSFHNFDNFYGSDNFIGSIHQQTVVEEHALVCHTQAIEIIQQRLLILQEMAKRIIVEQVCEVETQTVVFEQFHASLGSFRHDLHHNSGHRVGFDRGISGHFKDIFSAEGSLSFNDLGFSGRDLGSQTVVVGGSNWNDETSPASVGKAFSAAQAAFS